MNLASSASALPLSSTETATALDERKASGSLRRAFRRRRRRLRSPRVGKPCRQCVASCTPGLGPRCRCGSYDSMGLVRVR